MLRFIPRRPAAPSRSCSASCWPRSSSPGSSGDPCQAALQERATPEACADFNERYGFNDLIIVQFVHYAGDVFSGDLGESIRLRQPVTDLLIERLPVTLQLSAAALFIAVIVGVPLGVLAGLRQLQDRRRHGGGRQPRACPSPCSCSA